MPEILRKIIIAFAVFVFVSFFALLIAAWIMGAFDSVQTTTGTGQPGFFIWQFDSTEYKDIPMVIDQIKQKIVLPRGTSQIPAALIHDNPFVTPLNQVKVTPGIVVMDSIAVVQPLAIRPLKQREIVSASLQANPAIAIFKTYPALAEWLRKNDRQYQLELPFLERYENEDMVIVEMGISAVADSLIRVTK
jgi:hypothetical protein